MSHNECNDAATYRGKYAASGLAPRWVKEPPKVAGWYWWRASSTAPKEQWMIFEVAVFAGKLTALYDFKSLRGEWYCEPAKEPPA